jgi:hypothetical protein
VDDDEDADTLIVVPLARNGGAVDAPGERNTTGEVVTDPGGAVLRVNTPGPRDMGDERPAGGATKEDVSGPGGATTEEATPIRRDGAGGDVTNSGVGPTEGA